MSSFVQLRVSSGFVLPTVFNKLVPEQTEKALKLIAKLSTISDSSSREKILDLNIGVERPTSTQEKAALIIRAAGSKSKFRDFSQEDQAVISRAGGLEHAKKQMKLKV